MAKSDGESGARPARTALLPVLLLGLVLTACTALPRSPATAPTDDRPLVLTTFTVLADIARQVAGDHLVVESITKPGAEIHGYQPTPSDLRRAEDADLVIDNGLGLEAWFAQFMTRVDAPHVVVSRDVTPIPVGGTTNRAHHTGDATPAPNPHAWMSPLVVQQYVDTLVAAFSDLDPAHADSYAANGRTYRAALQQVHDELTAALATIPETHRVLVTCEGAFSYLARDTGLTEAYLWPVNAEQQATPRRVARAIDLVRARRVPAVFCESTVSPAPMLRVAESSAAAFGGTLYVDSLSRPDGPVPTYLALLRHDVGLIIRGLTREAR